MNMKKRRIKDNNSNNYDNKYIKIKINFKIITFRKSFLSNTY